MERETGYNVCPERAHSRNIRPGTKYLLSKRSAPSEVGIECDWGPGEGTITEV